MAPWQRSALHQPTVLLSPFSRMTLLKLGAQMSDRHRETSSDNEAVINKLVPWQRPALGFCPNHQQSSTVALLNRIN